MLTLNSSLGFAGKEITIKKGYAKFLYKINKVLPVNRKCNLQSKFLERSQSIIAKLNSIKSIDIYRESNVSLIRQPIVLGQVLRELTSRHKEISGLGIFGFKFNNITALGTHKLEVLHLSKKVCSINVVVHNVKK